ncbi:hypothetical protein [Dongia deserti]|uniref:hypothetical protein n=1 Tax=Dongia deserti TaxID=2268030 RepID=UPI000E65AB3D|nr:hypothetical protein [Dongia deserti]
MAAKRPKRARTPAVSGSSAQRSRKAADAADLRLLAHDAALAALKRLADLSRSEDERVALAASQELLNRAFGKASAAGAEDTPATRPLIIKIVKFGEVTRTQGG